MHGMTRRITTNDEGDYVDAQTGETLGAAEKADYEGYLHRLGERHRVGEQADRLVRIVDKHLPKVDAENRAYVMKSRKLGRCAKDCEPRRSTRRGRR